jgi:outer membrane protein OmpA-like peptidoglycan-associated protein
MLTSEDGFNFKPDSATFLNATKAQSSAENMAAEIERSGCDGPLYVVGYAASGLDKNAYNAAAISAMKTVSAARAAAFKALLEDAGVTIKLIPVGAGKGPTNDWDASGKFAEEMGKQNRFVEVTQTKPEVN